MRQREITKALNKEFTQEQQKEMSFHTVKLRVGKRKQQFLVHDKSGCPVGLMSCFGGYTKQNNPCPVLANGLCSWHH